MDFVIYARKSAYIFFGISLFKKRKKKKGKKKNRSRYESWPIAHARVRIVRGALVRTGQKARGRARIAGPAYARETVLNNATNICAPVWIDRLRRTGEPLFDDKRDAFHANERLLKNGDHIYSTVFDRLALLKHRWPADTGTAASP